MLFRTSIIAVFVLLSPNQSGAEINIVDQWRYTMRKPADGWMKPDFDDGKWQEGPGGFGSLGTPAARIGTQWTSPSIWLRKKFELDAVPKQPSLLVHHDEDAEVFINGTRVAAFEGYTTEYRVVPLDSDKHAALRTGKNVLAVSCRQTTGGQFIDVHLIDGNSVPRLPPAEQKKKPFQSELITKWGMEVTPENAWTEYPRPQMVRENWRNLNGLWDYAVTPSDEEETPQTWDGKILVPFALESKLGGVQRLLDQDEALWYRTTFEAKLAKGRRTLLNFEAVDYRCNVQVNGEQVGSHQGGNTPFSSDVTEAIKDGENTLVVRVEDATEAWQLRGKQVLNPRGIWYTRVSGIWQTVWLETVPETNITDLKITTDSDPAAIHVTPSIEGKMTAGLSIRVTVTNQRKQIATAQGEITSLTLPIPDAKLWSPESPHLYELNVELLDASKQTLDQVTSYAGIRTVGKSRDEDGHLRFTLSGEQIFHWGPLDQGWWPDGLLTPPSDEAMQFEIQYLKAAGFNMIRNHIKVKPRRYYYHCDRLGMMVWQDHVSGGPKPPWTRLRPNPKDADWPDEHHEQFMLELQRMIDTLESHPSIVMWVPFNEAWGQHRTVEVGNWTARRDPSRLVNIASGGNFWPVGDIVDHHSYPHPSFPLDPSRYNDFVKVVGEFGGHGYPVREHLWDANRRNWGYGGLPKNESEYKERFVTSIILLNELRDKGIAGAVYTQTTDVEGEINGLLTYDRKVPKIPAPELKRISGILFK